MSSMMSIGYGHALQFGISENTVRKATSIIFAKLGVANRTEATAMALRKGLVKL